MGLVPGKMNIQAEEDIEDLAEILGTTSEFIEKQLDASWVQQIACSIEERHRSN